MTQPKPFAHHGGMPAAETAIDAALVRRLLAAQHPDLADLPITELAEGWDNITYRLGEALLVRMPRRAIVGAQIVAEQVWLPRLAPQLPAAIPAPVRIGAPGEGYPWPWSVLPYLSGAPIDEAPLNADGARDLGAFLRALHVAAPADAPVNAFRGGPLRERADGFEERAARLMEIGRLPDGITALWARAAAASMDHAPVWLHGDLHPLNALAVDGRLSAVIDWIDLCAGDPATDLACLWSMLEDEGLRILALEAYGGASAATRLRAQGWAAYFGVVLLESGLTNAPRHAKIGAAMLARLSR